MKPAFILAAAPLCLIAASCGPVAVPKSQNHNDSFSTVNPTGSEIIVEDDSHVVTIAAGQALTRLINSNDPVTMARQAYDVTNGNGASYGTLKLSGYAVYPQAANQTEFCLDYDFSDGNPFDWTGPEHVCRTVPNKPKTPAPLAPAPK